MKARIVALFGNYQAMFCVCSFLGGTYRQNLCSGLAMVIAVNVGYEWELPRLSCLHWHMLGMCQDAG